MAQASCGVWAVAEQAFLNAEQLAERWGVTAWQVRALSREGKIPFLKLGAQYRYKLAAIEEWEDRSMSHQDAA